MPFYIYTIEVMTNRQPHLHHIYHLTNFISGRMFDSKDGNLSHMNQQEPWLNGVARSKLVSARLPTLAGKLTITNCYRPTDGAN